MKEQDISSDKTIDRNRIRELLKINDAPTLEDLQKAHGFEDQFQPWWFDEELDPNVFVEPTPLFGPEPPKVERNYKGPFDPVSLARSELTRRPDKKTVELVLVTPLIIDKRVEIPPFKEYLEATVDYLAQIGFDTSPTIEVELWGGGSLVRHKTGYPDVDVVIVWNEDKVESLDIVCKRSEGKPN